MKTQKESEKETHQRKLGIKCYNCLLSFRSFRLRLFLTSFIEKRTQWTYRPTDRPTRRVKKPLLNPDQKQEQRQKKEKKKSSKLLENRGQHKELKLLNPERRQRATPKTKKTHSRRTQQGRRRRRGKHTTAKSFHRNRSRNCARGDDDDDLRDLETVSRISMRTGLLRSSEFMGPHFLALDSSTLHQS